jgi:hypothetical protein
MKYRIIIILIALMFTLSCSKDEGNTFSSLEGLSDYEIDVIEYFKEVALGFEFGNASKITRKWESELKIFVVGEPNSELLDELDDILLEINELAKNGFQIVIVEEPSISNFYIFFGTGTDYAQLYPSQSGLVGSNWGLFSLYWNSDNQFTTGHMYVDIVRADMNEQKHLLREELTQSLGLARDSQKYTESIFQSSWTITNEYAEIDKDLIRLLYHPDMKIGLRENQVHDVLRQILLNE